VADLPGFIVGTWKPTSMVRILSGCMGTFSRQVRGSWLREMLHIIYIYVIIGDHRIGWKDVTMDMGMGDIYILYIYLCYIQIFRLGDFRI